MHNIENKDIVEVEQPQGSSAQKLPDASVAILENFKAVLKVTQAQSQQISKLSLF